jgi:hypothetical protein
MRRQEPALGLVPRGEAHRPYEFGVKVSVTTTLHGTVRNLVRGAIIAAKEREYGDQERDCG